MTGTSEEPKAEPNSPEAEAERRRKAEEAYKRGVLERGEAAPADAKGNLPPGVTHEIVGYDAAGQPILKRRRFSAY